MKALLACAVVGLTLIPPTSPADPAPSGDVQVNVTIEELPAALAGQKGLIKTHILTAARMWTDVIQAKPCSVEIVFSIRDAVDGDDRKLGYGKSTVSAPLGNERKEGKILAEQGWASLLRTGRHPSGSKPDVQIVLQTAYVTREFWWDPEPQARKATIPAGKLDALSVILHELGHALAFNGWIDPTTGRLGGTHMSTYDQWVQWDGRDFFFHGPAAMKVHGKPVPLGRTVNNYHHVGEEHPGTATDAGLRADLMTGYRFQWATRYLVTPLDIAILKDCGLPTKE